MCVHNKNIIHQCKKHKRHAYYCKVASEGIYQVKKTFRIWCILDVPIQEYVTASDDDISTYVTMYPTLEEQC